jgi:predicted esterase
LQKSKNMAASILPVVLKARGQHTATLIFLHGLGDTGHGWAGMLNTVRPDYLKIVCPNAPSIPVTMNQGFVMPAWYDIKDLAQDKSSVREDLNGVESSTKFLEALIDMEARELKNNSAGKSRILVGGFSQGGAVALNAILRAKEHFAGGLALSTYIAGKQKWSAVARAFVFYSQLLRACVVYIAIFQQKFDQINVKNKKTFQTFQTINKNS